ncbi:MULTISPECIES: aspartate ammonia-lyase [Sphingomonadales]|uniref:aspartate ammonia-lyase n=1 Tax=Sphingomonadales TaxID=204457 RepID=UPI00082CBD54|nr:MULTISPECIES: aspartate ammonia-lyase [Sphingomonadales]
MTDFTSSTALARIERDPLGTVEVPADRLYGAQTQRAIENFPISGRPVGALDPLVVALAEVKKACAITNVNAGEIAPSTGQAIVKACDEIIGGRWRSEFPIDVLQGGAGTSTNMNMNEVVANRALQILGMAPGCYGSVHPNDHVNRNQSTNDAYASAVRISCIRLNQSLLNEVAELASAFSEKAESFAGIPKLGRTQLQDAVTIELGDEFRAFADTLTEDVDRGREIASLFLEINLGGTAIGSGLGSTPAYRDAIIAELCAVTGLRLVRARNLYEASWDMGTFVLYSGFLKRLAAKLSKICNDLRLLASGPRGGMGEIRLPGRQAGSSLMPGKVNPVIPEAVNQVAYRVFGLDTAITFAAEAGQLQLNAFEPLIVASLHEAVTLLVSAMRVLRENCVAGIEADSIRCQATVSNSLAQATELVQQLGYQVASEIVKLAHRDGLTLQQARRMWAEASHAELDIASEHGIRR